MRRAETAATAAATGGGGTLRSLLDASQAQSVRAHGAVVHAGDELADPAGPVTSNVPAG